MLTIYGVSTTLCFIKILYGSRNFREMIFQHISCVYGANLKFVNLLKTDIDFTFDFRSIAVSIACWLKQFYSNSQ